MANTVTEAAVEVDEAINAISETSEMIRTLADNSARTSQQFRT